MKRFGANTWMADRANKRRRVNMIIAPAGSILTYQARRGGIGSIACKGGKGGINLITIVCIEDLDFQPEWAGSRLQLFRGSLALNVARVCEHADASSLWQ